MAQRVKNLPEMQETQVWSLGLEDPLGKEMAPTPEFLPGEFQNLYSLPKISSLLARTLVYLFNCISPWLTLGTSTVDIYRMKGWMQKNW